MDAPAAEQDEVADERQQGDRHGGGPACKEQGTFIQVPGEAEEVAGALLQGFPLFQVVQSALRQHHDRCDERALGGKRAVSLAVGNGGEPASEHAQPGGDVPPKFLVASPGKEAINHAKQELASRAPQLLGFRPFRGADEFLQRQE